MSFSVFACLTQSSGEDRFLMERNLTTSIRGSIRITNLPLDHWFPEHALVSSTCMIVLFCLIQSVSLNGVNPAFYPMFVDLVLAGVIRDAEDLLHAFEEPSLKRLSLISDQHVDEPQTRRGYTS
jgi:hypothetical protein